MLPSATSTRCTVLCGLRTWKCTFTDNSGDTVKMEKLRNMPSPESTLVIDQQGALHNWP